MLKPLLGSGRSPAMSIGLRHPGGGLCFPILQQVPAGGQHCWRATETHWACGLCLAVSDFSGKKYTSESQTSAFYGAPGLATQHVSAVRIPVPPASHQVGGLRGSGRWGQEGASAARTGPSTAGQWGAAPCPSRHSADAQQRRHRSSPRQQPSLPVCGCARVAT